MKLWDQAVISVRLLVTLLLSWYVMFLSQQLNVVHDYLHLGSIVCSACHVGHKALLQDLKQNAQSTTLAWMARMATVYKGTI